MLVFSYKLLINVSIKKESIFTMKRKAWEKIYNNEKDKKNRYSNSNSKKKSHSHSKSEAKEKKANIKVVDSEKSSKEIGKVSVVKKNTQKDGFWIVISVVDVIIKKTTKTLIVM